MVVGIAVVVVVVVVAAVIVVVVVAVAIAVVVVVVVVDADATCQAVELRPSVTKRIALQSTKSSTQVELVLWSYACHECFPRKIPGRRSATSRGENIFSNSEHGST